MSHRQTSIPKATIIIPSFNQAEFIRYTIRSALLQEGIHHEVVVIDGGSTDGTIEVLSEFGDRIRWESADDNGVFEALNRGFSLAQGDFIGWLNSDDVYFSVDVLSRMSAEFGANPGADVIYGDVAIIGEDNRLLRVRFLPAYNQAWLERSNIISQPAVFFRRSVVDQEQMRPLLSLDYEFWIRLGRRGFSFRHVRAILAGDRQYPTRASVRRHFDIQEEMRSYKLEYGIRSQVDPLRHMLDRLRVAPLRWLGVMWVLAVGIQRRRLPRLAFPMWIDSALKLVARQSFKSITDVGMGAGVRQAAGSDEK